MAHGLSCFRACGIFQILIEPCPLHWQANSYPLCHQEALKQSLNRWTLGSPSQIRTLTQNSGLLKLFYTSYSNTLENLSIILALQISQFPGSERFLMTIFKWMREKPSKNEPPHTHCTFFSFLAVQHNLGILFRPGVRPLEGSMEFCKNWTTRVKTPYMPRFNSS